MFASVELAIQELQNNNPVIIVDSKNRENEGDLIFPADLVDHKIINFMITNCRGLVCVCITEQQAKKLDLVLVNRRNYPVDAHVANFTHSIEASCFVTTGISAYDRATTIRAAVHKEASPNDISIPGHIFPIIGEKKGLLARQGHTEASMTLVKISGFSPSSVICEIANEDGEMAKLDDLFAFQEKHKIPIVTIESIISFMHMNALDFSL